MHQLICVYIFAYKPSFGGKLKGVFKPTDNWGPKNPRIKAEWMKEVIRREVDEVLK